VLYRASENTMQSAITVAISADHFISSTAVKDSSFSSR